MNDKDKSLEDLEAELQAASNDDVVQDDGTGSTPTADDSGNSDDSNGDDPVALKAQIELERKERLKIEMERNLLRKEKMKAERVALESVDKTKLDEVTAAYETLLEQTKERERQETEAAEHKAALDFRDSIIAQRPEAVQKAAKALIAKNETNLSWSNAQDDADAKAQIEQQLDALQEVLGIKADEVVNPTIHANNPAPRKDAPRKFDSLEEEVKFMESELPWADPR